MADEKFYADGTPIAEYPKMIYKEDGSKVVVADKHEENFHTLGNVEEDKPTKSEEDKTKGKAPAAPAWAKDK